MAEKAAIQAFEDAELAGRTDSGGAWWLAQNLVRHTLCTGLAANVLCAQGGLKA